MKYYMAPMEGITTYTFRNAYQKHYGGVDQYFTPFIASKKLSSRERNDILPEHNVNGCTIPQILAGRADDFLAIASGIAEYGYDTVNLNLGCPSATVVSRKRGSGFLKDPEALQFFMDEIFSKCPLKISVKTRIGVEDVREWERIMELYADYPLKELIIHPRLQKQGYAGKVCSDAYREAMHRFPFPICYNGDLTSSDETDTSYGTMGWLKEQFPGTETVMIGRGLLMQPGLITKDFSLQTFQAFHDDLLNGYIKIMSGDANTLFKMKDLWTFFSTGFEAPEGYLKKIRKSTRLSEYEIVVHNLWKECNYLPSLIQTDK